MPPPYKPPGKKESEGAIPKSSSTVARNETYMETDATPAAVPRGPPVPPLGHLDKVILMNQHLSMKQAYVNGPTTC